MFESKYHLYTWGWLWIPNKLPWGFLESKKHGKRSVSWSRVNWDELKERKISLTLGYVSHDSHFVNGQKNSLQDIFQILYKSPKSLKPLNHVMWINSMVTSCLILPSSSNAQLFSLNYEKESHSFPMGCFCSGPPSYWCQNFNRIKVNIVKAQIPRVQLMSIICFFPPQHFSHFKSSITICFTSDL